MIVNRDIFDAPDAHLSIFLIPVLSAIFSSLPEDEKMQYPILSKILDNQETPNINSL
jgi:hypothetical protein